MDEDLKGHREQLEKAINLALTDSPEIAEAIQAIRAEGFDIFLIVEATIGFCQHQDTSTERLQLPAARLELTSQDENFLRSLKISPD